MYLLNFLNMVKKIENPDKAPVDPEKAQLTKESRGMEGEVLKMDEMTAEDVEGGDAKVIADSTESPEKLRLIEFEQSEFGKEILNNYSIESILQIFDDEEIFFMIFTQLNGMGQLDGMQEEIKSQHYYALLRVAAIERPDWVREFFDQGLFEIGDPEVRDEIWQIVRGDEDDQESPISFGDSLDGVEFRKCETAELEEEIPSGVRLSLIEPGNSDDLPAKILEIIGDHPTFWAAMDDDESFNLFMGQIEELQAILEPELFSEVLIVAAEQDGDIDIFLKKYGAKSWRQAMQNHSVFKSFIAHSPFTESCRELKPPELLHEMLLVAAQLSPENAQWFLDKAKRDETGEKVEDPPYILREAIGEEVFERVMSAAKATLDKAEN